MAKKRQQSIINEVTHHYDLWKEDNDRRRTRENGWNDVIDAYWNKLPDDWPYISMVVDPRIRTTVLEKKARLTNSKLRGRLVPREGGDVMKAKINNSLLDFQWDAANEGGSMNAKWGTLDQDARLFGSSFGLVKWRREFDEDGKLLFDGNEMMPIDVNNVGMDMTSYLGVRGAKWVQIREWTTIDDLENVNDNPHLEEKKQFPGLEELKKKMSADTQDRRDSEYVSRLLQLKGLEDRYGDDEVYPVVEVVTEYRPDRWITFSPRHNVILRDIKNPYNHNKIPVVQLRYYPLLDDPWGESEVESVLPLWRAIQAVINGYLDHVNLHLRPPLKIVEGQVRMETIVYGPEAPWIMDNLNAVQEFQSSGDALRYFQTTYSSLVSAFNTAMGDLSQGVSQVDPFNPEKTATEVRATQRQQTVRDQNNQLYLAEAIQDMMSMWLSNNKQFLFMDEDRKEYILRIIGSQAFEYFKRSGMDEMELSPEAMQMIGDIITERGGEIDDMTLQNMVDAGKIPKYPVFDNPSEKDPSKLRLKAKMRLGDLGDSAELSIIPEDLEGNYDYVADVKSMSIGADQENRQGLQNAIAMMTNPAVLQLLQQENKKPVISEMLVTSLEQEGLRDAQRFFEDVQPEPTAGLGTEATAGPQQNMGQPGLPGGPSAVPGGVPGQQMA